MPFKKGASGNPNGRTPGASNKITRSLREAITNFAEGNFEQVLKDFKQLDAKDRVKLYTEFLPYVLPKLQSIDLDLNSGTTINVSIKKNGGDKSGN